MDRIEPYIGMTIVLGDEDMQMADKPASDAASDVSVQSAANVRTVEDRTEAQQARIVPQTAASESAQAMGNQSSARGMATQMQQQTPSCLTDQNCDGWPRPPQQTMMVGMAYVPWQRWQQPYDYEEGFEAGTIFPELNLPFLGYQRRKKG